MEYKFECPQCGGNRLNEIMADVTVDSEIDKVTDDGVVYGEQTNENGLVDSICCRDCATPLMTDNPRFGYVHSNITTHEELIEWLKNKSCGKD